MKLLRYIKNYVIWIAWRYLVSKSRKSNLSFMTFVSIIGVAIGVAVLIIVLSVMGGFEADLQNKMLFGEPHLEVMAQNVQAGFSLKEYPIKEIKKLYPDATSVEPFIQSDVVIKHRKHIQSSAMIGVDHRLDKHLWAIENFLDGEFKFKSLAQLHKPLISSLGSEVERPGIALGVTLANNLGVDIGDEITVLNPQGVMDSSSMLGTDTSVKHFVVVGIFMSGNLNFDSKWSVVSLSSARQFMPEYDKSLDEEQYVTGVAIGLKDPFKAATLKTRMRVYPDLKVISWEDVNSALLFALKLEKFTMGAILMLIVVVAAFSISGTLMMTVYHKRPQISLMRAIGMPKSDIIKIFMVHGFVIGTVGIVLGLLFGVGVCFLIKYLHVSELPLDSYVQTTPILRDLYRLRSIPVRFLPFNYVVICLFAWIFSLLATAYPAFTAAQQNPASGLRCE